MTTDAFPLDFAALNKGDVVSQDQIESIYQVRYDSEPEQFHFKAMSLMQEIERERPDLLTRVDGLTVRVMTDLEADEVTDKRIEQGVRTIKRNATRRARIDRNGFSEEEKKIADVRDRNATALMIMTSKQLRAARREKLLLMPPIKKDDDDGKN